MLRVYLHHSGLSRYHCRLVKMKCVPTKNSMSKKDTDAAYVFISMYHFPDLIYLPTEKEQRVKLYPPKQPNNI